MRRFVHIQSLIKPYFIFPAMYIATISLEHLVEHKQNQQKSVLSTEALSIRSKSMYCIMWFYRCWERGRTIVCAATWRDCYPLRSFRQAAIHSDFNMSVTHRAAKDSLTGKSTFITARREIKRRLCCHDEYVMRVRAHTVSSINHDLLQHLLLAMLRTCLLHTVSQETAKREVYCCYS